MSKHNQPMTCNFKQSVIQTILSYKGNASRVKRNVEIKIRYLLILCNEEAKVSATIQRNQDE
jgi:hypothetical protein